MSRIDVVTTARADYSLILPVVQSLEGCPGVETRLVFTGSHFSRNELGELDQLMGARKERVLQIACQGIGASVLQSGEALGAMIQGFARAWGPAPPDLVVVLGDRFEILAPASIAVLYGLPLGHLYGGEEDVSYCFDTQIRNAVTKMAHVHLVMHEAQRDRLLAQGEEAWRVHVCGNSALGDIETLGADADSAFDAYAAATGIGSRPLIAACYLPATSLPGIWRSELPELLAALDCFPDHDVLWAGVNADPESADIQAAIESHCASRPRHRFESNLGRLRYYGLLRRARVLVGNSSSGLLEAASFGLPAVNVGVRQTGRLCGGNVANVPAQTVEIEQAVARALGDRAYRAAVSGMRNPFARPGAADRIAAILAESSRMNRTALLLKRSARGNPATEGELQRVRELPPLCELHGEALRV